MHSADPRTGIRRTRAQAQRINRAVDEALQSADTEALLALMALAADEATVPLCDRVFRRATRLTRRDQTEAIKVIAARNRRVLEIYAHRAPKGWFSAWCDGSSTADAGGRRAGTGLVLMDGQHEVIAALREPAGALSPLDAELAALEAGDRLLLTKSVPIEATAIPARERSERLGNLLSDADIAKAQGYLNDPGIGVTRDTRLALDAGRVTAMHDPTEGGLAAALWELAQASGRGLRFDPAAVPVTPLSAQVCAAFAIDPLTAIPSGALLLPAPAPDAETIRGALEQKDLPCTEIGEVTEGSPRVLQRNRSGWEPYPLSERDSLAEVFESK